MFFPQKLVQERLIQSQVRFLAMDDERTVAISTGYQRNSNETKNSISNNNSSQSSGKRMSIRSHLEMLQLKSDNNTQRMASNNVQREPQVKQTFKESIERLKRKNLRNVLAK